MSRVLAHSIVPINIIVEPNQLEIMEPIPSVIRDELLAAHSFEPVEPIQGGMSGAKIWKCVGREQRWACLRAWPPAHPTLERLRENHARMRQLTAAGLTFTPSLYCTNRGATFAYGDQRLWELTSWLPGTADYPRARGNPRLVAALRALAKIHHVWSASTRMGPSPTVRDRLQTLNAWRTELPLESSYRRRAQSALEAEQVRQTFTLLRTWLEPLNRQLTAVADQPVSVHYVLRDIWSDHVLYSGDQVTGIIDFGAAREDEPATDLVRLLGSLEPLDAGRRLLGLTAYADFRRQLGMLAPCPAVDWQRVHLLDRVATLLSAAQWMKWLTGAPRSFEQPREELVERWRSFLLRLPSMEAT